MGVFDWLRGKVASEPFPASAAAPAVIETTPFVAPDGTADERGTWVVKVRRLPQGWALFVDAPHGAQPLAGIDPALGPVLERLDDGVDVPVVCRLLPGRPRNIRNMVAVRLGDDVAPLERVARQLPDAIVYARRELVVARFWQRAEQGDEAGAIADFRHLLAADDSNCDAFWSRLSAAARAATTTELIAWLETRVYDPEDLEDGADMDVADADAADGDGVEGEEKERVNPADVHPRALNPNRLYKLPVELWPKRALDRALATARHTGSLAFFPQLTFEVLRRERERRG